RSADPSRRLHVSDLATQEELAQAPAGPTGTRHGGGRRCVTFGGRRYGAAIAVALALAAVSCSPTSPSVSSTGGRTLAIGSFDFPESVLLATLYGRALAAH